MALCCLLLVLALAGCGGSGGEGDAQNDATPAPTATLDAAGYRAVSARGCRVADWTTMQGSQEQGDLITWRPDSRDLAYLAPAERTSWYVGELLLAQGPAFTEKLALAPGVLAAGDLTWSPSGDWLAFLAFRPDENLYTVMIVHADGSQLTDLFPTDMARTDARTSQKAIIGWKDDETLQVMASCGEQCRNAFDIRLTRAATPELTPTPVGDYKDLEKNLEINRRAQDFEKEDFPRNFLASPNWSPDDQWVAYVDRRLLLWVLSPEEKITFPIEIGLRDVLETQWASDSQVLAVRAEDRIFIFEIPCSSK
jgi:Tol biopolymer transport system component